MTSEWSIVATGENATVEWQASQVIVVLACNGCLPVASVPLWQLKQLSTIFVCSKEAGVQPVVE